MMILSSERSLLEAKSQFEELQSLVSEAAKEGRAIHEVERDLWRGMLAVTRSLLQSYVDLQGPGDMGETLERDNRTIRRLAEPRTRRYVSVFGEIPISRFVYATRETQKHEVVPLDARLSLPDGDFSYLLQEWSQSFCVQGSYEQAGQTLERILGIGQSVRSLEHMNRSMAQDVETFRDSQPVPVPEEEGGILVVTADGKGVPMRRDPEEKRSSGVRRKKGEKANRKRQACVGAVYTIEPFLRTAADVVDEVFRTRCRAKRPSPQHKQVRAELTRAQHGKEINGKDVIFRWFAEQQRVRGRGEKPVVCLMDGDRALWKALRHSMEHVIGILDLFHVMERLWDAAHCFYTEGSEEAQAFVTKRLDRLLQGKVGRVIGGLKQMGTKRKLRKEPMKRLSGAIQYLENNRHMMRYNEYLANGYPIGSGVVEGACRHLVKDRMEQAGMHWRTEGAQAMLNLRAVYLNGDWEAFQQHRIESKCRQLYPNRDTILEEWPVAA